MQMLKQPENVVGNEFKQHRLAALDPIIIAEYEDLVTDWMNTIDAILHDTSDERCI
jgi:dynein heavy chain